MRPFGQSTKESNIYLFCHTLQIIWHFVLLRNANATGLLLYLKESVRFKKALITMLGSFTTVYDVQVGEYCVATSGGIVLQKEIGCSVLYPALEQYSTSSFFY